jgi:uncharacterized membrane protein YedE/YeeE
LVGGALIGAAASALLSLNGRIAGVSGIVAGLFSRDRGEALWRALFVAGLVSGGLLALVVDPRALHADVRPSLLITALAGLLVGVGTRISGGCTSGHGVCGLSRLSKRSLVATLTFLAAGAVTVGLTRHFGGHFP